MQDKTGMPGQEQSATKTYITTIGGRRFDPTSPAREDIDIGDIAHSLSLLCRANGHFREFFSVARHCLNCAGEARERGLTARIQLLCLLHDATEAYIGDMTRPLKRQLPEYCACEVRLYGEILASLGIAPPDDREAAAVREIDDCMLYHEFRLYNGESLLAEAPAVHVEVEGSERPPGQTREEYLACYRALREETEPC